MFADWPFKPCLKLENSMADQKDHEKQDPGFTDQERKEERERAGQNPYDRDQASNPERGKRQDPQCDPSHIRKDDPKPETIR
jgi:hypothetical protein